MGTRKITMGLAYVWGSTAKEQNVKKLREENGMRAPLIWGALNDDIGGKGDRSNGDMVK